MKHNPLTDTKKLWIDAHINDYRSIAALHRALCEIFPEAPSYQSVQFYIAATHNPKFTLSEEEENWLIRNKDKYTTETKLTKGFNQHFNQNIAHQIMGHHYDRLNINYQIILTEEMVKWLRNQPETTTIKELHEDFIEKFGKKIGQSISIQNLRNICYNHDINYKRIPRRSLPLGTLRHYNGELYIKIKEENEGEMRKNGTNTCYPKPWWIRVSEYLYSIYVRPLKDDEVILYLDNNPNNFRIENLYAIPLNQLRSLSRGGLRSTNPELTKLGILNTQLRYALRETKEA